MDSLLDTINGIPVHALVVHAVVVLIPLTALGAVLMAIRPSFSRRFGPVVVVFAGLAAAASLVAKESGEQLTTHVGTPQPHVDLGNVMPLFAGGLFIVVLAFWLFDRGIPTNRSRPVWLKVLAVVMVLVAIAATWWVVRVGDSGAKAVWTPIMQSSQR